MGLMSTLAYLEASNANSAAQNAAQEARAHREFVENQQHQAYLEETKNKTRQLFQDIYNNNGNIEQCDLTHLERIKKPMESRVQTAMKSYDPLAEQNRYIPTKTKILIPLFLIMTLITFLEFINKINIIEGYNIIIFIAFLISLFFSWAGIGAYKDTISSNKRDKSNKPKREERYKKLENLALEFPKLLAGGITRKSYLDSVIYDLVETLIKNGNRAKVETAYKAFFNVLGDFNPNSVNFDNRFQNVYHFNKTTFSEYNNIIEN